MRFSWEVYKRVSFCYILFLSKEIGIYLKTLRWLPVAGWETVWCYHRLLYLFRK